MLEIKDLVVVETFAAWGLVFNNWQKSRALARKCQNMGKKFSNTGIVAKNGFLFLDFTKKCVFCALRQKTQFFAFLRFFTFCVFAFFTFLSFL